MVQICPKCKKQISDEDAICPHCEHLLIYEYQKQIVSQRNKLLIPLGIFLLFAAFLYDRYQSFLTGVMHGVFMLGWIVGFAIFVIYLHNGEYYLGWWSN